MKCKVKYVSVLVFLVFLLMTISTNIYAGVYSGGSGTGEEPYLISSVEDITELRNTPADYGKSFLQTADIDLTGELYFGAVIAADTDIGTTGFQGTYFSGKYDGNGFSISNYNITTTFGTNEYVGVFGYNRGEISNLSVEDITVDLFQGQYVGLLCGLNVGTLENCHSNGVITCGDGSGHIGGLCGFHSANASIIDCYSEGSVAAGNGSIFIGGLCGRVEAYANQNTRTIYLITSYSTVNVSSGSNSANVGGLTGRFYCYGYGAMTLGGSRPGTGRLYVNDCYSQGTITVGDNSAEIGGFCGAAMTVFKRYGNQTHGSSASYITNCYSTGEITVGAGSSSAGGFNGRIYQERGNVNMTGNIWNTETSGLSISSGGTGATDDQMRSVNTFLTFGWDFLDYTVNGTDDIWKMPSEGYPQLLSLSGCAYSISSTSKHFEQSGGTGSVSLTADIDCDWTAKSNTYWIEITSGSEGTGQATVSYTVAVNTGANLRTGTMTIAGKPFLVTQDGTCGTPVSISPSSRTFDDYSAVTDSVNVIDPDSCGWTAVSKAPNWITIVTGSSGIGNRLVTYSVRENTKTTSRTGSITIADITFTVTQNGKKEPDNVAPSVEIDSPVNGSTTDLVYFISGTSSDDSPSSGIDRVEIQVQVSDGSGTYLLGSDGKLIKARGAELWIYDAGNVAWEDNVEYKVTAKVYDKAGNSGEAVISFTFQIIDIQLFSTLSLELSSNAILQGNTIDVSGKLTRLPDDGTDISGNTINITITAPDGAVTSQTATTQSDGRYQIAGISGFTQKGKYTIQASFSETSEMTASISDPPASLEVGPFAGYAIIVEGKVVAGQEGLDSHNKTTNNIYNALLERGFIKDNIYYYNYDVTQDVDNDGSIDDIDGAPSKTVIQNAISNLAKNKMNSAPAPLYVILHDHGSAVKFYMGDEVLSPAELDSWLDTLESGLNSNALLEKRIIIYGACYSGSFISALSKASTVEDGGRVIVTSAASDEESYKGPMEPDGIRSGSYFLEEFFGELKRGYSIKDSFEKATGKTERFTRKGGGSANTNNAYFDIDSAMQHPLLDDGGDGVGSNALSDNVGDGQVAKNLYLGIGETLETLPSSQAEILNVTETLHMSPFETDHLLWATANNNDQVGSAWIEVRPPSQTLSGTGGSNTNQLTANYKKISLLLNNVSGNWETENATFPSRGIYEVFYFVSDKTTGEASAPIRSVVYKDKVGNNPPHIFNLDSPPPGSEEKTSVKFKWEAASDPDGDDITYNLLIATDEDFNDIVYRKEEITTTAAKVDAGAGLSDLTTYYWKVQAVDAYGLISDSKQTWPFYTNNTNFVPGFIAGIVYDKFSFAPIAGASLETNCGGVGVSGIDGKYIIFPIAAANNCTVNSANSSYMSASIPGINVGSGKTTELNIPMTSFDPTPDPTPDIKANGSDNTVTIGTGDTLSITVNLSAGESSGFNSDWWVAADTPFGWFHYDLSLSWIPGLSFTHQGPLFDLSTVEVLNMPGLPAGTYTFYFAVDTNMNGVLDFDKFHDNSVIVNVQ